MTSGPPTKNHRTTELGGSAVSSPETALNLVDIGVNLTDKAFASDRDDILARAAQAGVRRIVATGTHLAGSQAAARLVEQYPGVVYATAGVHPHSASTCTDDTIDQLRELASRPGIVAIGECGLDYNRNFSPPEDQRRWFKAQVELAADVGLPLFLHDREASHDLLPVLRRHRQRLRGGVVHCFTGTASELDAYLELDLHIGITGWICDERRGTHLLELVHRIPDDRLMVETDAPYLVPRTIRPRPKRGRNEPAFLPYVVEAIAGALGRSPEDVARTTTQTANEFFRLGE